MSLYLISWMSYIFYFWKKGHSISEAGSASVFWFVDRWPMLISLLSSRRCRTQPKTPSRKHTPPFLTEYFSVLRGKGQDHGTSWPLREDRQFGEPDVRDKPGPSWPRDSVLVPRGSYHPTTRSSHWADGLRPATTTRSYRYRVDRPADVTTSHLQGTTVRFWQLHMHPHYRRPGQRQRTRHKRYVTRQH